MTFSELHRVCKTTIQALPHVKDLQSYNAKGGQWNGDNTMINQADQVANQTAIYVLNLEKQFLEIHRAVDLLKGGSIK